MIILTLVSADLASSDHVPFVKSALEGLHKRNKAGVKGYLIHTSGTGVLSEFSPLGPGYATSKIYSDIANIKEITSLPMTALHRDVDDAVIAGGKDADVPTAIVCPPAILGVGKGPSRKRSIQIPWLTEAILKRGKGFTVGPGENWWDLVHIDDLAEAYIILTDEALKIGESNAAWGEEGYYFVEAGEFVSTQAGSSRPSPFLLPHDLRLDIFPSLSFFLLFLYKY